MDAPARIFFWTIDEAKALFVPAVPGFLLGFPWIGLSLSILSYVVLRYIKQNIGGGLLRHAAYWYLPSFEKKLKVKVPSYKREFIG
jgi:type IV conjugative transfer system protein TraL